MSTAEFWNLTEREFEALAARQSEAEDLANYRSGIIAAAIYNVNRDPEKTEPVKPMVFFEGPEAPAERSAEEILSQFQMLHSVCKFNRGES